MKPEVIPSDYDRDPERFRANVRAVEKYGLSGDVHTEVAQRLAVAGLVPVLDLGCGEGRLVHRLREAGLGVVALDRSATMLGAVPAPRIQGDARRLPLADYSFGAVAALYMLYHFPDPTVVLAEARRVLRPGGLFLASAPSRDNDPELAPFLPPASATTFDAENGPSLVRAFFREVVVDRWDAPLVLLPDRAAVALYLRGRQLPAHIARAAVARIPVPLRLTKRGALIIGRK